MSRLASLDMESPNIFLSLNIKYINLESLLQVHFLSQTRNAEAFQKQVQGIAT